MSQIWLNYRDLDQIINGDVMRKTKWQYDFADEAYQKSDKMVHRQLTTKDGVQITAIELLEDDAYYHKKKGKYISLEISSIEDEEKVQGLIDNLTKIIHKMIGSYHLKKTGKILIVGLGNEAYLSDALGPKSIKKINVTSHLKKKKEFKSLKSVSSLAPGVMSSTGMETANIIKALVKEENFSLLIVIDALATTSINRLYKVIQISDTGINPGSGVANHRQPIDEESIGCPVISIGVATVVESAALIHDVIGHLPFECADQISYSIIKEVLLNQERNYIMTSKDIDRMIRILSEIISHCLNQAINPQLLD